MVYREISHHRRGGFSEASFSSRNARLNPGGSARLVLPAPAQDPQVHAEHGLFYYCESSPSGIFVRTATDFLDFAGADRTRVWTPKRGGPASHNIWAPELHRIDGRCYIYFAADAGKNESHRMWVLGALTDDPAGEYELIGSLETGGWAIDGTTFTDAAGTRFFVWSGWPGDRDGQQNLYIARMDGATRLATSRMLLASPDQPWERRGLPLCEGPQILQRGGRTFLVYSASGSWTEHYGLGLLEHTGGAMDDPAAWRKCPQAFARNAHAWGVGHCGFATDAQGDDWILYHAKTSRRPGWTDREVRAQRFTWDRSGRPVFGAPLPMKGVSLNSAAQPQHQRHRQLLSA